MPRDTAATRARLIAAARVEFAARGIGGARVDRIAREAGVNKERIYGHFGNKEKLFEAVLLEALQVHTDALGLPGADIGEYVGRVYDFHQRNPQLLQLLLWEAQHYGDQELPDEEQRAAHYARKTRAMSEALGVDDRQAAITVLTAIGLAAWPLAVPQLTRAVMGDLSGARGEEFREQLVEFARRALAPSSSRAAASG